MKTKSRPVSAPYTPKERRAFLRSFRDRPEGQSVQEFCAKAGVSVPSIYKWARDKKAGGARSTPAKTWFQRRSERRMKNPRFRAGQREAAAALAKASTRKAGVALPVATKMSEVEQLRFENDILRRLVSLARAQGFQAALDVAWGAPRG